MFKYAGECIVIATGSGKKDAFEKLKAGELLTIDMVEPDVWFVDVKAVGDICEYLTA
jgi:hypothetical protein